MGLGTLTDRAAGQTILDTFFNDIHSALNGDFVGRNTAGVPTAGQNLGTSAIPWGTVRADTLILNGSAVDTSTITSPANRVVTGKKRSTSNQPAFITPNGAALSFQILASTTNLILDINGSEVTVTTNITKSGLTAAPGSANTATLNDADATGGEATRLWGEAPYPKKLTIASAGSNITNLVGQYAAFKVVSSGSTEYLLAFVESATVLSKAYRGYFYDSALAPVKRTRLTNGDTFTLLKAAWVFVENNATTIDVTYTAPVWSTVSPASPATGDYWYDMINNLWKRYDGATFQMINRTLVGVVASDATNCIAARCQDFYAKYEKQNSIDLKISTTSILITGGAKNVVNVAGMPIDFGTFNPTWNITTQLAAAADMYASSEQASTPYFAYVKDTGDCVLSDITPYYRADFNGTWYHPHNPWRCVGVAYNDGSSNLVGATGLKFSRNEVWLQAPNGYGSTFDKIPRYLNTYFDNAGYFRYFDTAAAGNSFVTFWPGYLEFNVSEQASSATNFLVGFAKNDSDTTTAIQAITDTNRHGLVSNPAGDVMAITQKIEMMPFDTVRIHTNGTGRGSSSLVTVKVTFTPFFVPGE